MEQLSKVDKVADKPLQRPSHHAALLVPGLREVGDNLGEGEGEHQVRQQCHEASGLHSTHCLGFSNGEVGWRRVLE